MTRIWIPHTIATDVKIAGDLEQLDPDSATKGRKLALVWESPPSPPPHITDNDAHYEW